MPMNTIQGYYDAENAAGLLPKVTQAIYNRTLLERANPSLVYDKFGQRHPLKNRSGKSMVFRRWKKLAEATAPLAEGVTPTGSELTKEEVIATIKQYGDYVTITDMLDLTNFDPIINEASEILGEQMGETLDTIYASKLSAGTNAYVVTQDYTDFGGTGETAPAHPAFSANRSSVAGVLNRAAIDKAINVLDRADAKRFTSMVSGANKENTWPMDAAYWAVIHPDITRDLHMTLRSGLVKGNDFVPVEQYASHSGVMPGEVGKYRNVRFVATTHCPIWADAGAAVGSTGLRSTGGSNVDVYSVLIFGRDAYGIVPLEKGSARTIIHRAGSTADPLNQRNTVGWKSATTLSILNDEWMVRLEVGSLA